MCDGAAVEPAKAHVVFDGSFDGFLCVVFAYYYEKIIPLSISAEGYVQGRLCGDFRAIATDFARSARVREAIAKKIGPEAYETLYAAFACKDADYLDLLKYVVLGFQVGPDVENRLALDYVARVRRLAGATSREAHRYAGFVRFKETKSGVLYSAVEPENYILPHLAEHFTQRLAGERWVIHDVRRGICYIFDGGRGGLFEAGDMAALDESGEEEDWRRLWKTFYGAVAVEDRVNRKRFDHIMPKKFRKYMTEYGADL